MAMFPGRFQRMAAAFDADVARVRLCESSGSEHSPGIFPDLSDLVNSFIESNEDRTEAADANRKNQDENVEEILGHDHDTKEMLQNLLSSSNNNGEAVKRKIRVATEDFLGVTKKNVASEEFKRQLMTHLRDKGLDAGLCKSKWAKMGSLPSGEYEYVDVSVNGDRYMVEVNLAREFEIARPTGRYTSLLQIFPQVFVGKPEELKQVLKLMCSAMRESLKRNDLNLPPWRRIGYMQAKWFGSYRRTTNAISAKKEAGFGGARRSIGFEALPAVSFRCKEDFAHKNGLRIGNLAAAFNES